MLYRVKVDVSNASQKTEGKLYLQLPTNPPTEVQLHDHSEKIKPGESYTFNKDMPNIDDIYNVTVRYRRRNFLQESAIKIEKVKIERLDPLPNRHELKLNFCGNRPQVLEDEQWVPMSTSRC